MGLVHVQNLEAEAVERLQFDISVVGPLLRHPLEVEYRPHILFPVHNQVVLVDLKLLLLLPLEGHQYLLRLHEKLLTVLLYLGFVARVVGIFLCLKGVLVSEDQLFDGGYDTLVVYVGPECDAELVDISLAGGEIVLVEGEVGKSKRANVPDETLVVGDEVYAEVEVIGKLLLVAEVDVKLLLENAVGDLVEDGDDEAVLLLEEAPVHFSEVGVALTLHVQLLGVVQPPVHRKLMVKHHHLRQDLLDRLFGNLLLEVPRHLYEVFIHH